MNDSGKRSRPLRLGMVGGGAGAYIGNIHRIAARLDHRFELVAGAFDAIPERGHAFAATEGIARERSYDDYQAMLEGESRRDDPIDVVAICTPNHLHFPIAKAFLEAGFDVICEKPMTTRLEDAVAMHELAAEAGRFLGVTYGYCGYPIIHEARSMIRAGRLGEIRVVQAEYPLEWMASAIEVEGNEQAAWRTDPEQSGRGGAIGDIGTHAYHLAGFVTGLRVEALCSDLATFVAGRRLDDNAHVMLRYAGGARGLLWASQVALGCSNGLRLRIFGEQGGLFWMQEQPNELTFRPLRGETVIFKRGAESLSPAARARTRTPPGHPEGFLESFGNLYTGFAEAIQARREEREPEEIGRNIPMSYDGLIGVAFVEAVVNSHEAEGASWVTPEFV